MISYIKKKKKKKKKKYSWKQVEQVPFSFLGHNLVCIIYMHMYLFVVTKYWTYIIIN